MSIAGQCMCGAVSYEITGGLRPVFNCHCLRCRRFTGHHMAATACAPDAISFRSDRTLRWYSPDGTVQYGFCNECGSSLFWRSSEKPPHLSVCAGALSAPTGLVTTQAWWVADAADYHVRPSDIVEFEYE